MKIVHVEPGKPAKIKEIGKDLKDLQEAVDGYIEAIYPYEDLVALVCNEEGKMNGNPPNRVLHDESSGEILDIIFGSFFVCGIDNDEGDFVSLTDEQAERFANLFKYPEVFTRTPDGRIGVMRIFEVNADE